MSLKAKLYLSFAVMIVLVVVIGAAALIAFGSTQQMMETTKNQILYVDQELIPESNAFSQMSTQVTAAGLNYYAYSFNKADSDYVDGDKAIKAAQDQIQAMDTILAKADSSHLPTARKTLPEIKTQVTELTVKARQLRTAVDSLEQYRTQVTGQIANMDGILNALLKEVVDDLENSFLDEKREGMPPVVQRRFARVHFLDELTDGLVKGQMLYWAGQGKFGDEAEQLFRNAIAVMIETADKAQAYAESPAIGSRASTKESFMNLVAESRAYAKSIEQFASVWRDTTRITADINAISNQVTDTSSQMAVVAGDSVLKQTNDIAQAATQIDSSLDRSSMLSWGLLAAAIVIGVALAVVITRSITLPVNRIIERLTGAERALAGASSQIGEASHELADGANEQAAAIEQTSSALEEMASMTRQNADNAMQTNQKTQATASLVASGSQSMGEMSAAMVDISDKSDKISQIIKTIEDISFQTNLLALNAAVEAARAGEAGKGFAVVADEVRNLSQRSAQAARDTSELITSTVESVRNGSSIAQKLSEDFGGIKDGTNDISRLIEQIANATDEQAQGVDQVNTAMAQMDKVTQQNAANASNTASSSSELENQVQELHEDIGSLHSIVYGGKTGGNLPAPLSGRGGRGNGGPRRPERRVEGNYSTTASSKNRLLSGPSGGAVVMRPDSVIPLDGE